jgi:hypothetical protein
LIRYTLRCAEGHRFDSWFASSAECDRLGSAGLLACAVCGDKTVEKDLMAPNVGSGGARAPDAEAARPLSAHASPAEQALRDLRRRIEAVSEDVGRNFAAEARRIHEGLSPQRPIIGEARPAEARALIEDGVPVAPLPWSRRKAQ